MDRTTLAIFFLLQAVALGALFNRFGLDLDTFKQTALDVFSQERCGLVNSNSVVLVSERVVTPNGTLKAAVQVDNGTITDVIAINGEENLAQQFSGMPVIDYGSAVISPGVIDVHVHLNNPGREEWEGMLSGTRAAAVGGVTTVVDMPLNSFPCTTSGPLVRQKLMIYKNNAAVNVAFWGGIVPENCDDSFTLEDMLDAGAVGFKSFLAPSGINDFQNVSRSHIEAALPFLKSAGVPYYIHAEWVTPVEAKGNENDYLTYLNSRPPSFEREAIQMLVDILQADESRPYKEGFRIHVAHLADAQSLEIIKEAKAAGLPISVETCPHYLTFASEDVPEGGTQFKCAPPLRDRANRDALWKGLIEGDIDLVASDHSPSTPELKVLDTGNFMKAWGGISGLQYTLPAVWSGTRKEQLSIEKLAEILSTNPAKLIKMHDRKGSIQKGFDADLVVWDPDALADTSTAACQHMHKVTPYRGLELKGDVLATWVKGHLVYSKHNGLTRHACGERIGIGEWGKFRWKEVVGLEPYVVRIKKR